MENELNSYTIDVSNKTFKITTIYEFDDLDTIKKNISNALEDYRREGYGPRKAKQTEIFSR